MIFHRTVRSCLENLSAESDRLLCTLIFCRLHKGPCIIFSLFLGWCVLLLVFSFDLVYEFFFGTPGRNERLSNNSFIWVCFVIMDITDSEEELFLTQNSFSQDILQPNFSLDSIFDPVVGSDEPAPRNSCAEELSKIVSGRSFKDKPKATQLKRFVY